MGKQHERTLSRQMAVQALYRCLVVPSEVPVAPAELGDGLAEGEEGAIAFEETTCAERVERFLEEDPELPDEGRLPAYAKELLAGAAGHMDEMNAMLADVSENWSVERMPVVDHAILLLAVHEMLERDDVPVSVCINEAVELAKAFGGEDESARFVNGLLGRIARTHCSDRLQEDTAEDQR